MREMTFRSAYVTHYRSAADKPRTVDGYLNTLRLWEVKANNAPIPLPSPAEVLYDYTQRYRNFKLSLIGFRETLLQEAYAAVTVNKEIRQLLAILNRLGPEGRGNPDGLGLMPKVPALKRLKEPEKAVRDISFDNLSAIYRCADWATWPRGPLSHGLHPGDWWRAFIVFEFNIGLRRGDVLSLAWEQIDLAAGVFDATIEKSDKVSKKPLHPVVIAHLQTIQGPWELVFPAPKVKADFRKAFETIQQWAGVRQPFYKPHDLRRSCGTAFFEISPGAAQQMLDHSSVETTRKAYANLDRTMVKTALSLEQPAAFLGDDEPDDGRTLKIFAG